jgi:hypothetical protein
MITLWKFNKVTGYWAAERTCDHETAEEWYRLFSEDNPSEYFYLTAKRKPTFDPVARDRTTTRA